MIHVTTVTQLKLTIAHATSGFDLFTVLATSLGPFTIQHQLSSFTLARQVMEVAKAIRVYWRLICTMTTAAGALS